MHSINEKLLDASTKADLGLVHKYLTNETKVNVQNQLGKTPLFIAASYGYLELNKLLVQNGAHIFYVR